MGKPKRRTKKSAEQPGGDAEDEEKRYSDINRSVSEHEVSAVRKAAEEAGLWRFCDAPRHDGFSI